MYMYVVRILIIVMTSRSDPARSHALSRRVASVACDAKFSKVKKPSQINVRCLEK